MLIWAAISLSFAIVTSLVGFGGGDGLVAESARVLAVVFLLLFLAALVADNLPPLHRRR